MLWRAWSRLLYCERGWRTTASGRKPLQGGRNEVGDRFGELGEQTGEIARAPVAGHVGLAEADQAVAADPPNHRVGTVNDHRRQRRVGGADHRAVGVDAARNRQARCCTAEQPIRDRAGRDADRPARDARHVGPSVGVDRRAREFPARSMLTTVRPFPGRRLLVRGTTGTRRSQSVMPWIRMPIAPISGASGATSCSRMSLTDAGSTTVTAQRHDECGLVVTVQ